MRVKYFDLSLRKDLVKIMNKQDYFPNDITFPTTDIVTSARYKVSGDYDADGYIKSVTFTKTT